MGIADRGLRISDWRSEPGSAIRTPKSAIGSVVLRVEDPRLARDGDGAAEDVEVGGVALGEGEHAGHLGLRRLALGGDDAADGAVARRHVVPAVLAARVVVGLHLDLEAGERDALAGGEADDAHGEAGAERAAPEDAGVGAGVVTAVLLAHVAGEAPGALLDLAREPVGHADGGDGGALPLRGAERERLDAALEGRADGRGVVADGGSHGGPGDGFSPLMTYSPRTFPSRGAAFFLSTPPRLKMIWGARRGGGQASVWGIGGDLASRNAGARRGGLPFTNPLPPCPPGN